MPRTSSTSSITGTGFMKCMPMKRSGRSVAAARRVIEIDEVLVASSASDRSDGQSSAKILCFSASLSVADSMARSTLGERLERRRRLDPADGGLALRLLDAAGGDLAREIAVDRGETRLDALLADVVQEHLVAGQRADMGDAAAHLARADHAYLVQLRRHFSSPCARRSISHVRAKRKRAERHNAEKR